MVVQIILRVKVLGNRGPGSWLSTFGKVVNFSGFSTIQPGGLFYFIFYTTTL